MRSGFCLVDAIATTSLAPSPLQALPHEARTLASSGGDRVNLIQDSGKIMNQPSSPNAA